MNWINYHHLFYFMTIAELGSVSAAAEELRLGQPTLSSQLKIFEDSLQTKLFDREHKKLILTDQGKIALDYARSIFAKGQEMIDVLSDRSKLNKIKIQIGVMDCIPKVFVANLIKHLNEFGACEISITEGRSNDLLAQLESSQIDLFFSDFIPNIISPKQMIQKNVGELPLAVYGAKKFEKLKKNFPKSLSGQKIILPSKENSSRHKIDLWLHTHNINTELMIETQDAALSHLLAKQGVALVAGAWIKNHELTEIGKIKNMNEKFYLIGMKRQHENPLATHLLNSFQIFYG